jgi:hypothetical protein
MEARKYLVLFLFAMAVARPVSAQAYTADAPPRLRALQVLQARRTPASLVRLLRLNGDQTRDIEKLGHPTNSAGIKDVAVVRSAASSYVAVMARRYPPEVKHPFGRHGLGICFLFDRRGKLKARFGGELGPDHLNGDDVQLKTLGTEDRCFVQVSRFEKRAPFTYRSDVYLIEEGFPLVLRIWGVSSSMACTDKPYSKEATGFAHFLRPGGLPWGARGQGSDGKHYAPIIGWDEVKGVFRGPSQIKHDGKMVYEIDLPASKRFRPVDRRDAKQKTHAEPATPAHGEDSAAE